jgi:hypothetical protein
MNEGTGFASFALYNALKTHFTSQSYDYFRYNGKTNVSKETFLKRKDKYSFYKLSRKFSIEELRNFYVANFVYGDSSWVGEMTGPEGEVAYKKWQKINQSLSYVFQSDIEKLTDGGSPEEMLIVKNGQHPRLLTEVMSGEISIETIVILNSFLNFFPMWDRKIDDDLLWPNHRLKFTKYEPFLVYEKEKIKNILMKIIRDNKNH